MNLLMMLFITISVTLFVCSVFGAPVWAGIMCGAMIAHAINSELSQ